MGDGAPPGTTDEYYQHGTAVAGVLFGDRTAGALGLCPDATLLPISLHSLNQGTDVAARFSAMLGALIERRPHLINLSLELHAPWGEMPTLSSLLDRAAEHGTIIVAAAGNSQRVGGSALTMHPWVVPVVPCDSSGHVRPPCTLSAAIGRNGVLAPGAGVPTIDIAGGPTTIDGASAAAACVTGALAALWSTFPTLHGQQLRAALRGGGRKQVTPPLLDLARVSDVLAQSLKGH